ncbi:MAG: hypothetical protein KGJ13_12510, partial [Patescibacteria group bacterium]|nr:hypothetical protein [Patescibacteria group bacterium]
IPEPPAGYGHWEADFIACADEGIAKLEESFKKAPKEFRLYITKHKAEEYAAIKKRAEGVK